MFLAQEILVGYSSYPTPEIERNAKAYRQLGLGYANLGALLMARGLPYDSDEGRAYAAAITALMTGRAYRKSAEIAKRMGPFAGYQPNAAAMIGVIAKHRAAVGNIEHADSVPDDLLDALPHAPGTTRSTSARCTATGTRRRPCSRRPAASSATASSRRAAGSSGSAPSAIRSARSGRTSTSRSRPTRAPREATQFYVNGFEQVVSIETGRGYRIQGTPTHRIKVVDAEGDWVWRRFARDRARAIACR